MRVRRASVWPVPLTLTQCFTTHTKRLTVGSLFSMIQLSRGCITARPHSFRTAGCSYQGLTHKPMACLKSTELRCVYLFSFLGLLLTSKQVYVPPYLAGGLTRPTFTIPDTDWAYGHEYTIARVRLAQGSTSTMRVSLVFGEPFFPVEIAVPQQVHFSDIQHPR